MYKKDSAPGGRRLFMRTDILVTAALLCIALGAFLWWRTHAGPGAVAVLTVLDEARHEMPLDKDGTYTFQGALPMTIEVKDGAARFVDSRCPDHICEDFGWISREGEYAICMPAGGYLTVEGTGGE